MKVHIFVQARLHSKRLPEKALLKILGKTLIELIVERLRRVKAVEKIVLVTGPEELNQPLVEEAKRLDIEYFSGSEENLLDRFYQAAKQFRPDAIVRVTGDNPFIDPALIDKAIERFSRGDCDIVFFKNYPVGACPDIFSREALERAWNEYGSGHIELITKLAGIRREDIMSARDLSNYRLTVDDQEDFEHAKAIYEALYFQNPNFGLEETIAYEAGKNRK